MRDFNADSHIDVIRDLERSFAANEIADACEPAKDVAMVHWCEKVSEASGQRWRFIRVNQSDFDLKHDRWNSLDKMVEKLSGEDTETEENLLVE